MWQFKELTGKIFRRRTFFYDNLIFRLHYRMTFWILLVSSILVTMRKFIGDHIHCLAPKESVDFINTYCFFSTTFTVVKHHNLSSRYAAHPGVGPYVEGEDEIVRHAYYQWVPFVLFGQGLTFYAGHYLWKRQENGRLAAWAANPVRKEQVLLRLRINRDWAGWLVTSELLNAVNLILQVWLNNYFLQGGFLDLGLRRPESLDDVFPKVTKCTFRRYGPSGTIQLHDHLCIVALNVINEKIYWVLWWWLLVLGIASAAGLLWRAVTMLFHNSQALATIVWGWADFGTTGPRPRAARALACAPAFADWLFIYYLAKNLQPKDFREIVSALDVPAVPAVPPRHYVPVPQAEPVPAKLKLDMPDKGESDC